MSIKRFNFGFGFFGPREYCDTGKFVDADKVRDIIDNECRYYVDKIKHLKEINSDLVNDYEHIKYELNDECRRFENAIWIIVSLIITNAITFAILLWTKYGN